MSEGHVPAGEVATVQSEAASLTSLVYTPTYFVATVVLAIVLVSVLFERAIHYLGKVRWLDV